MTDLQVDRNDKSLAVDMDEFRPSLGTLYGYPVEDYRIVFRSINQRNSCSSF